MFSIPQIINIAKTSLYLASLDVQKGYLYSPRVIPESPKMIYMETKAVEWAYNTTIGGGNLYVYNQQVSGIAYQLFLAGVPNPGDEIVIEMQDNIGNNETFSYTVVAGDTIESVYQNLEPIVLASPNFNASVFWGVHPYFEIDSDSGIIPVTGTTTITLNLPNISLTETGNYLYSICRGYNLEALNVVTGGGGTLVIYKEDNLSTNYDLYLSGLPNIGDEVNVTIEDSLSNISTFTYVAVAGNTAVTIMNNLVTLINASTDFSAIYVPGVHPYISIQSNYGLVTVIGSSSIVYAF